MNIAVRYYSRSGNTKKLADAIAGAAGVTAVSTDEALQGDIDLLFLGGAIYAGSPDKHLKAFASQLKSGQVKRVAFFSNAAGPNTIQKQMAELLKGTNIQMEEECFACRGKFLMAHKGRPNEQDCEQASAFAKKMING